MEREIMPKETDEVHGFAKIIWAQLIPLNNNPTFKQAFKDQKLSFLINIADGDFAALIKIEKGVVSVESVKNGDKAYMDKQYAEHKCDAYLEATVAMLIAISTGELSTGAMLKNILRKKMRVKNIKKLKIMQELFNFNQKSLNIHGQTLMRDVFKIWADFYGDKTFLTYVVDFDNGLDEKYSYKDMHAFSNRLANGFLNIGIGRGTGIALMNINSPEYIFTVFAGMKLGAYIILVNTGLKGEGLKFSIDHSDASAIVVHWSFLDTLLEIKDQMPKLKKIIVDLRDAPNDFKVPAGCEVIGKLMEAPDIDINVVLSPDDLCMLMYTAGTTGLPKAISFWQGKLLGGLNVKTLMKLAGLITKPTDIVFTPLPLFHSNALFLSTFSSFLCGLSLVLGKKFSATRHWDICRKYDVTVFNTLGAIVTFLMKQPPKSNDKDHKVTVVNTAACPKDLWQAFEERFDVKIAEAYGATDGGGFMLLTMIYDNVPVGTMGKPMPGVTAGIMDDGGKILPDAGQVGELVFLVPEKEIKNREVKYYREEKASKDLIQVGKEGQRWFHTGDLAYQDKDGWFFFVDRKKDSIRKRGENITPYSIESIIDQHEKVLESAAYGVKSNLGEDEIMVSVVCKSGESMTPQEVTTFCKDKMADFMVPRYIDFVKELPKNEVHRIQKNILKERGITPTSFDMEKK